MKANNGTCNANDVIYINIFDIIFILSQSVLDTMSRIKNYYWKADISTGEVTLQLKISADL